MTDKTGGPAFPTQDTLKQHESGFMRGVKGKEGMTLLDYFAGSVRKGLTEAEARMLSGQGRALDSLSGMIDRYCWDRAEAMLAERERRTPGQQERES